VLLKKKSILYLYIVGAIEKYKYSLICYDMKIQNIYMYIYNFNQDIIFLIKIKISFFFER